MMKAVNFTFAENNHFMKKFAIVVAGGSGTRMGTDIPKQFLELCGKPVLMHTIEIFHRWDNACKIILVLPESQQSFWQELCQRHGFAVPVKVVAGGDTRFFSVKNGLQQINDAGIVLIHDGVRPLVSSRTLDRCVDSAIANGNAIPALPVTESLRKKDGDTSIAVDRSMFFSVQTPQTFQTKQIQLAYSQEYDPIFTDDASLAEKAGFPIFMVEGNRENIKITTPEDLIFAEALLKSTNERP